MDLASEPLLSEMGLESPINGDEPQSDGDDHAPVLLEKSRSPLRWPVLLLACLMLTGSYYCFDIPSALKTQLNDYMGEPPQAYETKVSPCLSCSSRLSVCLSSLFSLRLHTATHTALLHASPSPDSALYSLPFT